MQHPQPVRVLIADDHPVVRTGLQAMLTAPTNAPQSTHQAQPHMATIEVIAAVSTPQAAIDYCTLHPGAIDVVLMDLRFGDTPQDSQQAGGVAATQHLRTLNPAPQVLIITNYSTDADILGAISAGAVGYLLKDTQPETLTAAIHQAARGESVLTPQIQGKLLQRITHPMEALSNRELDVLNQVANGASNKHIAQTLVLTEATIKTHLTNIFHKLGVNNRTAAVAVARERGIIT